MQLSTFLLFTNSTGSRVFSVPNYFNCVVQCPKIFTTVINEGNVSSNAVFKEFFMNPTSIWQTLFTSIPLPLTL